MNFKLEQFDKTHREFLANAYSGKSVLLIGGDGQVGTYIQDILWKLPSISLDVDVTVIDKSYGASWAGDITHRIGEFSEWVEHLNPDYVFCLAAHVTGVTKNERCHFEMCLDNTLIGAAMMHAVRTLRARVIVYSTACCYAHDVPVPTPEIPVEELGEPEPTNAGYAHGKHITERLANYAMTELPNLDVVVVRPFNLYGREDPRDPDGHVIPRFTWRLLHQEDPMIIRGPSGTRRSFTHALDAAWASLLIGATGFRGTLNIGDPCDIALSDLLEQLAGITGFTPTAVEWGKAVEQGYPERRPNLGLLDTVMRDRDLPVWRPSVELVDGLTEYVNWARTYMRI